MIKKGFDLFTTSHSVVEEVLFIGKKIHCCNACMSPFLKLCKPFCKYRKATVGEWLDIKLGKEWRQ